MPAKSRAQQRLMGAAEHGASFPAAQKLRQSMTHQQLHDFAAGSMAKKPEHASLRAAHASHPNASRLGNFLHPKKIR